MGNACSPSIPGGNINQDRGKRKMEAASIEGKDAAQHTIALVVAVRQRHATQPTCSFHAFRFQIHTRPNIIIAKRSRIGNLLSIKHSIVARRRGTLSANIFVSDMSMTRIDQSFEHLLPTKHRNRSTQKYNCEVQSAIDTSIASRKHRFGDGILERQEGNKACKRLHFRKAKAELAKTSQARRRMPYDTMK